jgi:DNA-binding CsgD family transcriptional regulator
MSAYARDRAAERLDRLTTRALDAAVFFREAQQALLPAIGPVAAAIWHTVDPDSLLMTGSVEHDGPPQPEEVLRWEYLEHDVLKVVDVARSPRGIQTLAEMTGGRPSRSALYRRFLRPYALEHVVHLALRAAPGAPTWGSLVLVRAASQEGFTSDEVRFLEAMAPKLALGAKRSLLVGAASDPDLPDAPGLVVVAADGATESLSPGVERWLDQLPGDRREAGLLPDVVLAVAARALRTFEGDARPGEVAMARTLTRSGRWVVLHGAAMAGDGRPRAAVIVEPAHPAHISALLMDAYGLTSREQQVTRLVLQGDSTAQIAASLVISAHTVQQHLKNIFEKTGVRSRRDLVGKVFFAHYDPRVRDNDRRVAAEHPIRGGPFPAAPTEPAAARP